MTVSFEALRDLPAGQVVVVGIELERVTHYAWLREQLPAARFFSISPGPPARGVEVLPRWPAFALLRLRLARPRALIVAQDYRNLRLLLVASGAPRKLVLRHGALHELSAASLLWRALRRGKRTTAAPANVARRSSERLGLSDLEAVDPGPRGPGNDYAFIARATRSAAMDTERRRVIELEGETRALDLAAVEGPGHWCAVLRKGVALSPETRASALEWLVRDPRAVVLVTPLGEGASEHAFREAVTSSRGLREHPRPEEVALHAGGLIISSDLLSELDRSDGAHLSLGAFVLQLAHRGAYFIADSAVGSPGSSLAALGYTLPPRPRVSVYVPAYNAAAFIERAVRSALAQTLADLEVCVVDDGSTDATPDVLARLASEDSRVRWSTQPNRGISAASNAAVRMGRADYVLQLDADDELLPRAAEVLAARLDRDPRLALVYGGFQVEDPSSTLYRQREVLPKPYDRFAALHGNVATHPRMFRRRDYARTGGFDESLENAVDFDIYLKLAEQGPVEVVPEVLYRYYIHGGNTSVAKRALQYRNHLAVIRAALERRGIDWEIKQPDPENPRKVEFRRASSSGS